MGTKKISNEELAETVATQLTGLNNQLLQSQTQLTEQLAALAITIEEKLSARFEARFAALEDRFNRNTAQPSPPKQRPGKAAVQTSDGSHTNPDLGDASDRPKTVRFGDGNPSERTTNPSEPSHLRLEEAKAGGRLSSVPSPSKNSGLEGGKRVSSEKKLYAFVSHEYCDHFVYTLFALDIPDPDRIVKTVPTEQPSVPNDPERTPVVPILRFSRKNNWPVGMRCIHLGSKLYFLGGKMKEDGKYIFPRDVYVLDLSEEIPPSKRDRADQVLKQVASMKTGKSPPFVYFLAGGKIFVVSDVSKPIAGMPLFDPLIQFEIFNPTEGGEGKGKWEAPVNQPPFHNYLSLFPPLVIDGKVFFGWKFAQSHWCYDIAAGIWSHYSPMDRFGCSPYDLAGMLGGEVVGEAVWKVCNYPTNDDLPTVAFRLDISERNKKKKENKPVLINQVVVYAMQSVPSKTLCQEVRCALTSLGSDSSLSSGSGGLCFCFLEYESQNGLFCNDDIRRINVTLFEIHDGKQGSHSANYITSAHYCADIGDEEEDFNGFLLEDAHLA